LIENKSLGGPFLRIGEANGQITVRNGRFRVKNNRDSTVNVPDQILKCVGFIGEVTHIDADGTEDGDLHATGFFVSVPAESPELLGKMSLYFVTAKHVAKDLQGKKVYFLVNRVESGVAHLKGVVGNQWWLHPADSTADLALIPINNEPGIDIRAVGFDNLGTKEKLDKLHIGAGDETFATGLFTHAAGIDRNLPIVRHGNIAMMPTEQIQTELGYADVYLVEARSLGGLSGSPVFVRPTICTPIKTDNGLEHSFSVGHGLTLLGLMHGHWDIKESEMNNAYFTHDHRHGVNYGIAIVVPAYKIVETLNRPELVALRKEAEQRVIKAGIPGLDAK
jgi:hypothetical protein